MINNRLPIFLMAVVAWFFVLFPPTLTAQHPAKEDLLSSLPLQKDTSYVLALLQVIRDFENLDTALAYAEQAYVLSEKLNYDHGKAESLYSTIEYLRLLNKYDQALHKIEALIPLLQKSADHTMHAHILMKKAFIYTRSGQSKKALNVLLEGLQLTEKVPERIVKAKMLFELGDFYRLQREPAKSLDYFKQSLAFFNRDSFNIRSCRVLFYMASTYKIFPETGQIQKGIDILNEMRTGPCSADMGQYEKAKLLNNLGSMYAQIEDYPKAKQILTEALELKRSIGNPNSLVYTLNELSTLYFHLQDFNKSLEYAKEAYSNLNEGSDIYVSYDVLENLSVNHSELGNFKEAYEFQSLEYELRDSILNQEKASALTEMEAKYEFANNQQAIASKDLEIAQQQSTFNRSMSIGLTVLFFITGLLFWYRYRLEKQKMKARQYEEMDRLKSGFYTNITHEFRTPLTLILNSLPDENTSPELNKSHSQIIRNNANRLLRLINQLMDLSRLEAHKMKLSVSKGDIDGFLRNMVDSFKAMASQKNIVLQYLCLKEPGNLYFDQDKLEKVISNLLSNAIKFGTEHTETSLVLDELNDYAVIKVIDKGIGIVKEDIPYIFDRFHQADESPTRDYEGSGIGLALAKQLVEIHHGRIEVFSEKGKGSTFTVFLPLGIEHFKTEEIDETSQVQEKPVIIDPISGNGSDEGKVRFSFNNQMNGKFKVLIIEDHPELRQILRNQLQNDYSILEAENGKEGIACAIEQLPELIICDVMMPKQDGYQVCQILKTDGRTRHIPIIMLTAKSSQEEKIAGLEAGADAYLVKPYDKKELHLRINNLIQEKQKLKQIAKQAFLKPETTGILSRDETFLAKVNSLIEAEMENENFGVEELSQLSHMSRSQMYRKIKAIAGVSPNAYIRKTKMDKARQLLEKNAGNVSEIALLVGFSNTNYFYKCFKDEFGITPGEILKSTPSGNGQK